LLPDLPPETIQETVQDFVRQWNEANPKAPVSPEAEEGAVPQMAAEFIEEWNALHPDFPIDLDLPDNASEVIEEQLGDVDASVEVDLATGDIDPGAQEIMDAEDKSITTTANLAEGTTNPEGKKTRDVVSKKVTTTMNLAEGTTNSEGKKTRDVVSKKETTTMNLAKGTTDLNAEKTRDAVDQTVTTSVKLAKSGWTSLGGFVGTALTVLTALSVNQKASDPEALKALSSGKIATGADTGEDPVHHADLCRIRRNEGTALGHDHQQCRLPDIGGFTCHIRPGQQHHPVAVAVEMAIVGNEAARSKHLLHHRMAAAVDDQPVIIADPGPDVGIYPGALTQ